MRKKVSAESVVVLSVGVALAGLVQVRFSGIESRFSGLEKQILSVREDVSELSERVSRVGGILAAEFGYGRKSESPGGSADSRVAEVVPPF